MAGKPRRQASISGLMGAPRHSLILNLKQSLGFVAYCQLGVWMQASDSSTETQSDQPADAGPADDTAIDAGVESAPDGAADTVDMSLIVDNGAPLIEGPAAMLWAGAGGAIFLLALICFLMMRGRARRQAATAAAVDDEIFQPAGDDAEITFEEDGSDIEIAHRRSPSSDRGELEDRLEPAEQSVEEAPAKKRGLFGGLLGKKTTKTTYAVDDADATVSGDFTAESGEITASNDDFATISIEREPVQDETAPKPVATQNFFSSQREGRRDSDGTAHVEDARRRAEEEAATIRARAENDARDALRRAEAEEQERRARLAAEEDAARQSRAAREAELREAAERDAIALRQREEARQEDQRRRLAEQEASLLEREALARQEATTLENALADRFDRRFDDLSERLERQFGDQLSRVQPMAAFGGASGGDLGGGDISNTLAAVEEAMVVQSEAMREETRGLVKEVMQRVEAKIDAVERVMETRSVFSGGDGEPASLGETQLSAFADLITRRLAEHRDTVDARLADLSTRVADAGSTPEDVAALRRDISDLKHSLGDRRIAVSAPRVQLADIVKNALPPSSYELDAVLTNNRKADCLVKLPYPPGPIVIDAQFPLEAFQKLHAKGAAGAEGATAENEFRRSALRHIVDVAERMIEPEETADSALMFLPSEAMFAELHARFPDIVQDSYRARVWIVSPTNLMATLHTIRAVLRDAQTRENAAFITAEARNVLSEVDALRRRVAQFEASFDRARSDVRDLMSSTDQVYRRAETITSKSNASNNQHHADLTRSTSDADRGFADRSEPAYPSGGYERQDVRGYGLQRDLREGAHDTFRPQADDRSIDRAFVKEAPNVTGGEVNPTGSADQTVGLDEGSASAPRSASLGDHEMGTLDEDADLQWRNGRDGADYNHSGYTERRVHQQPIPGPDRRGGSLPTASAAPSTSSIGDDAAAQRDQQIGETPRHSFPLR